VDWVKRVDRGTEDGAPTATFWLGLQLAASGGPLLRSGNRGHERRESRSLNAHAP
jgi:hypothetical protein